MRATLDAEATAGPQTGTYSTDLHAAFARSLALGYPDAETLAWWERRSYAGYSTTHPVAVPTLLIQGTSDPIFKPTEALRTFNDLRARDVPVRLMFLCGGHGPCPYGDDKSGDGHADDRVLAWFGHWLRGEDGVDLGPAVEFVDNTGSWHEADDFADAATRVATVDLQGRLVSSGAKSSAIGLTERGAGAVQHATPSDSRDPGTLAVDVPLAEGDLIAGIPRLRMDVTVRGPGVHLFAKFLDVEANEIVQTQEMPIRLEAATPAAQWTTGVSMDLVPTVYRVPDGHHIVLQISTSSTGYLDYRGPAIVDVSGTLSVPLR